MHLLCIAGDSKSVLTNASKKAEEAVKTGRLVVTGQLLEMLTKGQRPRSTGVDKAKIGGLKLYDVSLVGSGVDRQKKQPTASVPELQTETIVDTPNRTVEVAQQTSGGEVESVNTYPHMAASDTSTGIFCPKITSIVSLDNNSDRP